MHSWLAGPIAALALVLAGAGWSGSAGAQDLLPVPPLSGRVIDQTATLSAAQKQALEAKLAAVESQRGSQLVVLIVPSTLPEGRFLIAFAKRTAPSMLSCPAPCSSVL